MTLNSLMNVITTTKYNINVFNSDCVNRDIRKEDIIALGNFDLVNESLSEGRKRINFLEKYSNGKVYFVYVNRHGIIEITILV